MHRRFQQSLLAVFSPGSAIALTITVPLVPLLLSDSSKAQLPISPSELQSKAQPTGELYQSWQTSSPQSDINSDITQLYFRDVINLAPEYADLVLPPASSSAQPLPESEVSSGRLSDQPSHQLSAQEPEPPPSRAASDLVSSSQPDSATALATPSLPLDGTAPAGNGQLISAIQVRFLNKKGQLIEGHTHPYVFTRELDLKPGTSYQQAVAQQGLDRILRIGIVQSAKLELEPTADPNQAVLVVWVRERQPVQGGFGVISSSPSALEGPFQPRAVLGNGNAERPGLSVDGNLRFLNLGGNDQTLQLQVRGGERVFDIELSFTDPWIGNVPIGISFNLFNQRSVQAVFAQGKREVNLPNGNPPWVHRVGGGVEIFHPFSPNFRVAAGIDYQRIAIRNSAFETETFNRDQLGNRLTVSDTGEDDLLTLKFSAELRRLDRLDDPTRGWRLRLGLDQAIPIGNAQIQFTRFSANYAQFIPLNLFGFAKGPRTLVVNGQAGVMLGDVPPYEAFNLSSIPTGAYAGNSFGTGTSFALLGAEYRFPIANFRLFQQDVRLGGNIFGSYATVFGTDTSVIGQPSVVRDKPGAGWAYGLGLRALTNLGILRLQFGLNDQGDGLVVFSVGNLF